MSDDKSFEGTVEPNGLGTDGTIPNTPDGIAVGHDPDGSNFNPEEDVEVGDEDAPESSD